MEMVCERKNKKAEWEGGEKDSARQGREGQGFGREGGRFETNGGGRERRKKKKPRDVSRRKGDEPFATFARPRWISKNKTLAVRWDLG
jgi:hypothetical protein